MAKDFYIVLGVSRDADLSQIKSAYRKLVKLYHPDAASVSVEKFIEVHEAYRNLTEPEQQSEKEPAPEAPPKQPAEPLVINRSERKPAVARSRRPDGVLSEQVDDLFSEVDEFFAGWVPGLYRRGRQTSRHKDLFVELVLTPSEARAGGMLPLQIPVEQSCASCEGSGFTGALACQECRGRGRVVDYHQIEIAVPPGVVDGTEARLSLADIGLPGVNLIATVLVE